MYTLPAEWYKQDAILLAWPHDETEWDLILDKIEPVYLNLCRVISQKEKLLIVVRDQQLKSYVIDLLAYHNINLEQIQFVIAFNNDIWIRDYGPITLIDKKSELKILNFTFNGWGKKYDHFRYKSYLDNQINQEIIAQSVNDQAILESLDFVLEGGAIESDGKGTLLTTKSCLLNPNRNPQFTQQKIEIFLCKKLGLRRIIWLEYGQLPGDDTDGHIDTLVRFAPHNTLVYMTCNNPKDDHYQDFKNLENQLKTLKNLDEQFYRLIPLPWPQPKYDQKGNRLPASYANYLIINNAILVPTYDDQADETALKQIQKAYPNHEIIGIYCLPLIYELGSLHCMTMQLPKGFLK